MWRLILTTAYLSSAFLVPPRFCAAASATRAARPTTLKQFLRRLNTEGTDSMVPAIVGKLIGLPPDCPTKGIDVTPQQTLDGMSRSAQLVFDPNDRSKVVGVFWTAQRKSDGRSEAYSFNTATDGAIRKAVRFDGQIDKSGKAVRGATKPKSLDASSTDIKDQFKRDILDFWLKGVGRKAS